MQRRNYIRKGPAKTRAQSTCRACGVLGHRADRCPVTGGAPTYWNRQTGVRCNLCASLPHLCPPEGCRCGNTREHVEAAS